MLDEAWIPVILDSKGLTKEVSLKELFANAHNYQALAGDMETQNFALLRVLLAVLHTVFSRFDANGEKHIFFDLDARYKQLNPIDEEDLDEYTEALYTTWLNLWDSGQFPEIVGAYLEKWRDRFYLFDAEYPFFQVREEDISADKISSAAATLMSGKNINRLISESGNKTALFSPKYAALDNKSLLTEAEIARWLIAFQSYTGLADKVILGNVKYKNSKGWLFDLGGLYFKTANLFETLMLNFVITQVEHDNLLHIQKPCWEYNSNEVIARSFEANNPDNLASLYTAWSRAVYINPDIDVNEPFECSIVKLPEITHQDNFLEPMTVWNLNQTGENKGKFTPKKHQPNKAMWRSFGLIVGLEATEHKPGILSWFHKLMEIAQENNFDLIKQNPVLCAISMRDDGNATSWLPTDEIVDNLQIDDFVLTDLQADGWIVRINSVVQETQKIISFVFRNYISDIKKIRNIPTNDVYVSHKVETLYYIIDTPFRQWLAGITIDDDKEEKIKTWRTTLKTLVKLQAESIMAEGSYRDYKGIEEAGELKNIATAYNHFIKKLNNELII